MEARDIIRRTLIEQMRSDDGTLGNYLYAEVADAIVEELKAAGFVILGDQPSLWDAALPDPGRDASGLVRNDHPDTARQASWSALPRTGTQRRRVLERIATRPSTDEEIQRALAMSGNTERPRRVELVGGGWIRDSGDRRAYAPGGDPAIVWCLTARAGAALTR
jgi:hypothetical protein